jgi:hypothetical protein
MGNDGKKFERPLIKELARNIKLDKSFAGPHFKEYRRLIRLIKKRERQSRLAWLRRPQVATEAFEHLPPGSEELPAIADYRAREREELAKRFDWSGERLALFRKHIVEYKKTQPSQIMYLSDMNFPRLRFRLGFLGD